jgi:MULE transposase domain
MEILAPQEQEFEDYDAAFAYIQDHARTHGFALSQGRKRFDKRKPPTVRRSDFRCDKGGKTVGCGVLRNTGSRLTECPFDLRLVRVSALTERWRVEVANSSHNHAASVDPRQHSKYRKPLAGEKERINQLTVAGVPPRMIVSALQAENSNTLVGAKEVYNVKVEQRSKRLQGLTPIEKLIQELESDPAWAASYTTDDEGHVNYLFLAYQPAVALAQSSPELLLVDATYRTNRYNMPLLHFMGVTCLDTSFSSAFCFMAAENESMYRHAIVDFKRLVIGDAQVEAILTDDEDALKSALTAIFPAVPQLLCFWHVEKRVLTKAKSLWRVNNVDEQTNKANQEKKKELMERWKQASIRIISFFFLNEETLLITRLYERGC